MPIVGMSSSCYRFTLFYAVPVFLERHIAPQSCPTLCDSMECSTPGFPVLHHLPEFTQTNVRWVNDAIQSSHPLLPSSPPALNLSQHQDVFQWVDSLHQVGQSIGASALASVLPMNIQNWFRMDFRMDWFALLAVQGTFESLLSHHILKASVLQCSAFFMVQLSHPTYMTTGKTMA